ncbi:hypothetical protein ANN_18164 [Periplaneta americana]|uniref:Uncharacterized protein n=1 Tax=Periplaneta americana TaxID=6978 RepID=A0ABQ8SNH1_PERAM|nr:hypothetical protein ANN_18164 [Periplaneta americana]
MGRPTKSFHESSDRTKRQKTENLRATYSSDELSFAAEMSLRSSGKVKASKIVNDVTATSPMRPSNYQEAYKRCCPPTKQFTGTEAFVMCIDDQLTRLQYNIIRQHDKRRFPPYKRIQKAKQCCFPQKEYITLSETAAEVNLQALLDHTASCLLETQKNVFHNAVRNSLKLILICKWGFDDSTQSEYKQTFSSESVGTDSNVFLSSFVPIHLIDNPDGQGPTVFWQNARTSSTRYCRPIRFRFQRETANLSKLE